MKTFKIYKEIECRNVRFQNRYGIDIAGDLYLPAGYENKKSAAIAVSGPFGGVKEQSSGLYAQEYARMGFVGLAFDQSFCGESGGNVRDVASPEVFTEDFSAAVDFIGSLPFVDREKIGITGICGLSGMALTAASHDIRIKAVSTVVMYDMHRSISEGVGLSYTKEQRNKIKEFLAETRWNDVDNHTLTRGQHELGFLPDGSILNIPGGLPDELPDGAPEVLADFYGYYKKRAYHPNSINSTHGWTQTTPYAFFNFSLMENIDEISPRPVLIVTGENAHSRYFAEDAYAKLNDPKEIIIVPGATHVDLYDQMDKIPFVNIRRFFESALS